MVRAKHSSRRNLEIEIKIPLIDPDLLNQLPGSLTLETPRHFEDNWMLDTTDEKLKSEQSALRVRFVNGRGLVTFKGLTATASNFKAREELETHTEEPHQMVAIFERLGYHTFFRYQKYRTVYKLAMDDGLNLTVMLDETPMGNFLELEGTEDAVKRAVSSLKLTPKDYITSTYIGMQAEHCRAAGKPLEDLLFPEEAVGG